MLPEWSTPAGSGVRDDTAAFAAAIFEPDDIVEVRALRGGGEAASQWCRAKDLADPTSRVRAWISARTADQWNVYVGANPRTRMGGTKTDDVALARTNFVDFDGIDPAQIPDRIAEAGLPAATLIIATGGGGHAYWKLAVSITDMGLWRGLQKRLIAILGTDEVVHDPPRIMRLPGTANFKRDPVVRCRILSIGAPVDSLGIAPEAAVHDAIDFPRPSPPEMLDAEWMKGLAFKTRQFISEGAPEGDRNQRLFRAACDAAGNGATVEQARGLLVGPAGRCGLAESEVDRTIRSAYAQERTPARPPDLPDGLIIASLVGPQAVGVPAETVSAPEAESPPSGSSVSTPSGGAANSWPEPQSLPNAMPPVMAFDPALLPDAVRDWIVDIADRVQCPIDFPAVAVMVALSSLVGRKVGIRPKRQDDWLVVPNLWGAVIGRPGVMKTPAIQEPIKPLKRLEMEAKQAFDAAVQGAAAAKLVSKVTHKLTETDIKNAAKKSREEALEVARRALGESTGEPVRKRYVLNDSTVEKLGAILNENPDGVLVFRDELVGLLKSLDKEGQEGARAFYLEAWNGTGRYCYDRIGRGTIDIEAAIVSIVGGIQPGPLGDYLRGAAREGSGDDGLIQRFQLLVWPDISREWVNVDRWPDSHARDRARAVFDGLAKMDADLIQGIDFDPHDPGGIPFLRFTEEAQAEFNAWRAELERTVRSGDLHPAIESHLAKYRSLIPSLALICHLADGHSGPVGVESLRKAIGWGRYLQTHARRVYAQAICAEAFAARALARKIVDGAIKDGFVVRDVYRNGWTGLSKPDDVKAGLALLAEHGWVREVQSLTGGRTGTKVLINPALTGPNASKFLAPPSEGTDGTDRSPPDTPKNAAPHSGATDKADGSTPSVGSVGDAGGGASGFQADAAPPVTPEEEEGTWTA